MDFLFDNPLASMYGPEFLVLYGLFGVLTITAYSILKQRLDKTENFPLPLIPASPDPFEIAFLRGGANELARAVIFSLTRKELLKFSNEDKTSLIYPTKIPYDNRTLSAIEQTALGWFGVTRATKEVFQKNGLSETLKPHYEMYEARLELQNLLPDRNIKKRNNSLALKAFLVFGGLGFYKIVAALFNGYANVFGIIIIAVIGFIGLAWAAQMPRLTKLGKAYLERMRLAFEKLKASNQVLNLNQPSADPATFSSVDPFLLSVGVFGGSVLVGTMYNDYNEAFQKAQNQSAASSCGSACGSSSYSSGGSDGGGSCSSGCGGCGGCS